MKLTSRAIPADATIAARQLVESLGGLNLSPDLTWTDAPAGTKSFAITCFDPDAPTGSGWWHWVHADIPATVTSLDEGAEVPGVAYINDYGYAGYGGPCPPSGPAHRYSFTVYALDVETLGVPANIPSASARFTILAHTLASATLNGYYAT